MSSLFENSEYLPLLEPYAYLLKNPGKNMRTKIMEAFNIWYQISPDQLKAVAEIVEMLHTSSLLIDDIEDGSDLRRGNPTAHIVYGVPLTLNCGNLCYFIANLKVNRLNTPGADAIFTEEMINLHLGQGMDLYWREKSICPTQDQYIQMIKNKTGGLLRLAVRLMQLFSTNKTDYTHIADLLGVHFQIRDDFINLASEEYKEQKGNCEDITEGKFSLPVIHSITLNPNSHLLNIMKKKTRDENEIAHALHCINETYSLHYTLDYVIKVEEQAKEEIGKVGGNKYLISIIDHLAAVYRNHNFSVSP